MRIGEFVELKIEEQPAYERIFERSMTRTIKDLLIAATIVAITSLAVIMGRLWRLIAGDHTFAWDNEMTTAVLSLVGAAVLFFYFAFVARHTFVPTRRDPGKRYSSRRGCVRAVIYGTIFVGVLLAYLLGVDLVDHTSCVTDYVHGLMNGQYWYNELLLRSVSTLSLLGIGVGMLLRLVRDGVDINFAESDTDGADK